MFNTPVVLNIFNRPNLTAQVLNVLRLVQPARLFIVADGPRAGNDADAVNCAAARELIETLDWKCELLKLYSETNLGCGRCVSRGIAWVFEQVEEAIFIEDDTLPDPSFFPFCHELLERYRDDERIAMITGTNFLGQLPPAPRESSADYVFSRFGPEWGWASWKRSWQNYDFDLNVLDTPGIQAGLAARVGDAEFATHYIDLGNRVRRGKLDVWDTQISIQQILWGTFTIVPRMNLITNLGFGEAATNTRVRLQMGARIERHAIPFPLHHPATVRPDDSYDERYMAWMLGKPSFDILSGRIESQFAAGRYAQALLWLRGAQRTELAASDAERAHLALLHARALYGLGQRERAYAALDNALQLDPQLEQALHLRETWNQ
jgi:hypothetical protein